MADEVLGHVYEVITQIALEDYTKVFKKDEQAFYEQKPKGITIKPDLTIGVDKDHPRIIFQIHHTNAESASHHKFWRNIGEFVDARLALGSKTIIANIVFDSGQKRQLAVVSEALFDGFIEADRASYGKDLLKLGEELTATIKANKVAKVDRVAFVRGELKASPKSKKTVQSFAVELEATLLLTSKLSSGWFSASQAMHKMRPAPRIPGRRVTTVRRGLGRLLPVPDENVLRVILAAIRTQSPLVVPGYMPESGLASPVASGKVYRVDHQELTTLTSHLDDETIVWLWSRTRKASKALLQACSGIEQVADFPKFHSAVDLAFAKLSTRSGMKQALAQCFEDPDNLFGNSVGLTATGNYGVWLFDYVMTVIKASTGKQQGYGYTRLDGEANTGLGTGIGPHVSDFASRQKPLRADLLAAFSEVLAKHLKDIGHEWFKGSRDTVTEFYLRGLFEDKIYKSSKLDPLSLLIERKLKGIGSEKVSRFPTLLSQEASRQNISTVEIFRVGPSVVLWQSASDKGVAHKTKELMGRIGMLRVTRAAKGGLVPKSDVAKVALVIDGTWSVAHIQRLVEAGADGIFYPDEMDKLAAFLK
jgi:hypothetical protein